MSITLDFRVEGIEALSAKLEAATNAIPKNIQETLAYLARIGYETAYQLCPVKTGYLQSTIGMSVSENLAVVYVTAPYAIFVNFGTYRMAARPFMLNAAAAVWGELGQVAGFMKIF